LNAVILLFPLLHITPLFISRQSFCWSNRMHVNFSTASPALSLLTSKVVWTNGN